jgi:starvation-inducible outer membrane lipoprotein
MRIVRGYAVLLCLFVAPFAIAADTKTIPSPAEAAKGNLVGTAVLWGGRIFERESKDGQTCVGVVAFPLSRKDARPETRGEPGSIFYACASGELDASDYAAGRQIAVAGKIAAVREAIVSPTCTRLPPNTANRTYKATVVAQGADGCTARMPSVAISDSHTWADPPAAHPPQFM